MLTRKFSLGTYNREEDTLVLMPSGRDVRLADENFIRRGTKMLLLIEPDSDNDTIFIADTDGNLPGTGEHLEVLERDSISVTINGTEYVEHRKKMLKPKRCDYCDLKGYCRFMGPQVCNGFDSKRSFFVKTEN